MHGPIMYTMHATKKGPRSNPSGQNRNKDGATSRIVDYTGVSGLATEAKLLDRLKAGVVSSAASKAGPRAETRG
jgi:hypothetical protein